MNGEQQETSDGAEDRRRDALAFLSTQTQAYERYRTQKESMTWLATAAYVAGTAVLVGRNPFWACWPTHWFVAWMGLLFFTAIALIWFVQWQFSNRNKAAAFFDCCNDVAAQWLEAGIAEGDLRAEQLRAFGDILVPRRLAVRFGQTHKARPSVPQVLTLSVMLLWTVGAFVYVMLTYRGQ